MMMKRIFALASVTTVCGLVAATSASGCSSSDSGGAPAEEAGLDGSADAKKPVEASDDIPDTGAPTCPTTAAIDATTNEWKPPNVMPGACTGAMVDALVAAVDASPMIAYPDLKAKITDPTCKACLFAPDGAKWAAFVEDASGAFLRQNFGGCVAVVSGQEACGKAFSQYEDCTDLACQDCADETSFNACNSPASKGACKTAASNVTTVCGSNVTAIDTCQSLGTKYLFESAARALCVGLGDGGTDAGDDAGDGG
jgi:hypothetical protein